MPAEGWPYSTRRLTLTLNLTPTPTLTVTVTVTVTVTLTCKGLAVLDGRGGGAAPESAAPVLGVEDVDRVALQVRPVPPVHLDGELAYLGSGRWLRSG